MCVALTVRIHGVDLPRGQNPGLSPLVPSGLLAKKISADRVIGADKHQAVNRLTVSYSFLAA